MGCIGDLAAAAQKVAIARSRGCKIVLANGAFDLLHIGHLRYLQAAKAIGDYLVVAVNSDISVKKTKGPNRPIVPQSERVEIVAALAMVDFVVMFDEPTVANVIEHLRPDIQAKGTDYTATSVPEALIVQSYGGRVEIVGDPKDHSTTETVTRLQSMKMPRRGVPLVVSAPSGCGKTTICQKLLERTQGIEFSISHTTRKPRGSERNGNEYHFISNDEFTQMVKASMFLEWAKVHDNYYGTSRSQAESRLNIGIDVLFDIDVQGGKQLHSCLADVVLVFILPPNLLTLSQRLHNRGTDDEAVIQRRLAVAKQEIEQASFYNYWIINDHLEDAVRDLEAILFAERLRCVDKQAFRQQMLGNINHVDR